MASVHGILTCNMGRDLIIQALAIEKELVTCHLASTSEALTGNMLWPMRRLVRCRLSPLASNLRLSKW
jgi:hypothetical protein